MPIPRARLLEILGECRSDVTSLLAWGPSGPPKAIPNDRGFSSIMSNPYDPKEVDRLTDILFRQRCIEEASAQ